MRFFDTPELLYAAPGVALLVAMLAWWVRHARLKRAGRWSVELLEISRGRNRWSAILLALVTLAAMVALAGPRWGTRIVQTETKGLNLVIAVDVSRSMLAEDVAPSRLARARNEARRLIHDLPGDRIGLIAFAGRSFILSPLTVDGGAINMLVDGLDPDLTSAGGTELARVFRQGRELLLASPEIADRVLVVFTDGEAHDSLASVIAAATALREAGIHLVLVAEGEREPARIPVRAANGSLVEHQRDEAGEFIHTARRDDILSAAADAAEGAVVAAVLADQADAIHDLVAAYKRAPSVSSTAANDISRAWIPLLVAVGLLMTYTVTRRSAALAAVLLSVTGSAAAAQGPRNAADDAWTRGNIRRAAELYIDQLRGGGGGDTTWLNSGTAALALGDTAVARAALGRAAESVDRGVRFRALYNLGLLELRLGLRDSTRRDAYLAEARRRYREALLLAPGDSAAKWNLELSTRLSPPSGGGGGGGAPPAPSSGGSPDPEREGLSPSQADQILQSIAQEEARTRAAVARRRQALQGGRGRRDW